MTLFFLNNFFSLFFFYTEFKVRLTTLELAIKLIKKLVIINGKSFVNDFHLACIEQAREQSAFLLRRQFRVSFNISFFLSSKIFNLINCEYKNK